MLNLWLFQAKEANLTCESAFTDQPSTVHDEYLNPFYPRAYFNCFIFGFLYHLIL